MTFTLNCGCTVSAKFYQRYDTCYGYKLKQPGIKNATMVEPCEKHTPVVAEVS